MRQPFIIVGAGTDVSCRVILPTCRRLRDMSSDGQWPEHAYALLLDGDEQTRSRHAKAGLPADRAPFVPLSLVQVREALAWRRDEFKDAWRPDWQELLIHGPDNGACMVPAIGRMMVKAARPAIVQHLRAFERRLNAQGGKIPEFFIVWSPVSGTSRGSVIDLPRYIRAVFPESAIRAVIVHPVGVEAIDPAVSRIFQANFIEALRIIDHYATTTSYESWVDDAKGWETFQGRLIDTAIVFDHRYGNGRFRHLGAPGRKLETGLEGVFRRVTDFLVGTVGGDPIYDRMRARFADADMHRSDRTIAGHRTYLFGIHEARASLNHSALMKALTERAIARVAASLEKAGNPEEAEERGFFGSAPRASGGGEA